MNLIFCDTAQHVNSFIEDERIVNIFFYRACFIFLDPYSHSDTF